MVDELEVNEIDAVDQQNQDKDEDAGLPEKMRGKSKQDIAKMYLEAEKTISRQGQEVGEVRKLADELLRQQLSNKKTEEKPKVDFFENPDEAIRQAVESNPAVVQAREYAIASQQEIARQKLYAKHPDTDAVIAEPDFRDFIGKSKVRQELLQRAHNNFDVDAGDELLTTYKEMKAIKAAKQKEAEETQTEAEKQSRSKQLNDAFVDSGGAGEGSKKIYRRSDLLKLRLFDPRKYDSMSDEINRAYVEGRVR